MDLGCDCLALFWCGCVCCGIWFVVGGLVLFVVFDGLALGGCRLVIFDWCLLFVFGLFCCLGLLVWFGLVILFDLVFSLDVLTVWVLWVSFVCWLVVFT